MSTTKIYPIAEIFTSPQGEGLWSGVSMTFIRLAGCTVGRRYPKDQYKSTENPLGLLPIYTFECTTHDGRKFPCDTDYSAHEKITVKEIVSRIPPGVEHVCISGGEPFMHNLTDLVTGIYNKEKRKKIMVHIETSGTLPVDNFKPYIPSQLWITVSPKWGVRQDVVDLANEIKLLVDDDFKIEKVPQFILEHPIVYIQPINGEIEINYKNLNKCLELQKKYPKLRISVQMHKVEHVR